MVALYAGILARRSGRPAVDWWAGAGALAAALLAASLVERGRDVSDSRYVLGLVIVALLGGSLPFVLYYVLGRLLGQRGMWVFALWFGSLFLLYVYLFIVALGGAAFAECPPDAYECPL